MTYTSASILMSNMNGTRKPGMPLHSSILLAIIAGGLGAVFLYWSLSQFWHAHASRNWASTQGSIVESRYIDHGPRKDGEARIRYKYSVQGNSYEGGNLLAGNLAYTDRDEEEKTKHYKPGMSVTVYYDAQRPESSALEIAAVTRMPYLALAFGLLFGGAACYIAWCLAKGRPVRL